MRKTHTVGKQVDFHAHHARKSLDQRIQVAGVLEPAQQGPAIGRLGVPAGQIALVVIAVLKPDRLVPSSKCLSDLQRLAVLLGITEVAGKEIDLFMGGGVRRVLGSVRIGVVEEDLVALPHFLQQFAVFLLPSFFFEVLDCPNARRGE